MSFYIYLAAGFLSGLLGGMGMGGGTVLIPVLTLFAGVEQHVAQAANLIAFLPMAALTVSVHKKQNLIGSGTAAVIIPAVIFAVLGGVAASALSGFTLKKLFGAFLIILGFKGVFTLKLIPGK